MEEKESKMISDVFVGKERVGELSRNPDGLTIFKYDPEYVAARKPQLSVCLPISKAVHESQGLHPFFSNLVSEGWLEEAQKRSLKERKSFSKISGFDILSYFGRDCIGAVSVISRNPLPAEKVQILNDFAATMARANNAVLPGIQPKLLAIKDKDGNYRISGQDEISTHIVKFDFLDKEPKYNEEGNLCTELSTELPKILENEFVTTKIVSRLLPKDNVSESFLGRVKGFADNVLLITRFDRTEAGEDIKCEKIDFREFAQLLGKKTEQKYDGSYKQMADYIRERSSGTKEDGIKTNIDDVEILFKRICVSLLVGNSDAHLKNYALIKCDDEYRLTPNYDLISCALYKGKGYDNIALKIGQTESLPIQKLQAKHIADLAKDFGIEPIRTVELIEEIGKNFKAVKDTKFNWSDGTKFVADKITDYMSKRWNGTFSGVPFMLAKQIAKQKELEAFRNQNFAKTQKSAPAPVLTP